MEELLKYIQRSDNNLTNTELKDLEQYLSTDKAAESLDYYLKKNIKNYQKQILMPSQIS